MPRPRKITRKARRCPRGVWDALIDSPLPLGDPDYNRFHKHLGPTAWSQYRDEVLTYWTDKHPGTRPARWWLYEANQDAPPRRKQAGILRRLGLLTADEEKRLADHLDLLQPVKME